MLMPAPWNWEFGHFDGERYDDMRAAYEAAVLHAAGASGDVASARGTARVGLGTAIGIPGIRRRNGVATEEAYEILTQAARELWPFAQTDGANGELSVGQRAFARALAWQTAVYGETHHAGHFDDVQSPIGAIACHYRIDHASGDLSSFYPPRARNRGEEGTVIIRAVFDDTGHVTRVQTAAAAPETAFSTAGEALVRRVVFVRDPDSPSNCVMPRQYFVSVRFSMP